MKRIVYAITLSILLAITMSGCFPTEENNYSTNKITKAEKADIDSVIHNTKHINEKVYDNFFIDADVNINIQKNFNIYTAVSSELDFELMQNLILDDKKIAETNEDENDLINIYEDGSTALKSRNLINQNLYEITKIEYYDKDLDWFYMGSNDFNGRIDYERDTIFNGKDLDFMSSDSACNLVKEKMEKLGITSESYQVYTVDYDYIAKKDAEHRESFSEFGEQKEYINYTKDDEFYIVVPQCYLPNGGLLREMYYTWIEDDISDVNSGIVYAIVGKNGILKIECSGVFDITGEDTSHTEIVSLESALEKVKENYKDVVLKEPLTITNIELSYIPYVANQKKGTFQLKPTWVFDVIKEYEDGSKPRCVKLVDAITGELVILGNEDAF